jgi:hypothetical protein
MGTVDKVGGGLRSSTLLDFIVDCCGYFADLEIAARGAQYRHTYVNPRRAFRHIADGVFALCGSAVFHVDQYGRPKGRVWLGK